MCAAYSMAQNADDEDLLDQHVDGLSRDLINTEAAKGEVLVKGICVLCTAAVVCSSTAFYLGHHDPTAQIMQMLESENALLRSEVQALHTLISDLQASPFGLYCLAGPAAAPLTAPHPRPDAALGCNNPFTVAMHTPKYRHLFEPLDLFPTCLAADNGTAAFEPLPHVPALGHLKYVRGLETALKPCEASLVAAAAASRSGLWFSRLVTVGRLPPHCVPNEAELGVVEVAALHVAWLLLLVLAIPSFGYVFIFFIGAVSRICPCKTCDCCDGD